MRTPKARAVVGSGKLNTKTYSQVHMPRVRYFVCSELVSASTGDETLRSRKTPRVNNRDVNLGSTRAVSFALNCCTNEISPMVAHLRVHQPETAPGLLFAHALAHQVHDHVVRNPNPSAAGN
jgi:hypothetical protein